VNLLPARYRSVSIATLPGPPAETHPEAAHPRTAHPEAAHPEAALTEAALRAHFTGLPS
jgi:hypothetical protein